MAEMSIREKIEAELTRRCSLISPITIEDSLLFRQFGDGYKNTLTYNAQAANGWNPKGESKDRLGLKYYDGNNLLTIGYFRIEENPRVSPTINGGNSQLGFSANSREAFIPKLESGGFLPLEFNGQHYFHLLPCEASPEKIAELSDLLYQISKAPVYVKKLSEEQKKYLLENPNFAEINKANGWHPAAPLEDDTFPEQIIDLEAIMKTLSSKGRPSFKDHYLRAKERYKDRIRIEEHDPDNEKQRQDALEIVSRFFKVQEEKQNHFSLPEDYFNIISLKPEENRYFSSIVYIGDKPAAFYFAERANDAMHVYASLALYSDFPYLSEFIFVHLFQEAFNAGVKTANLGGSETHGLHSFKQKFRPIAQKQMHWLMYNPGEPMANSKK